MTVDVEDYFQVSAFEPLIPHSAWSSYPERVAANTDRILGLFAEHDLRATFFVLGWVAERHRRLVRAIADAGHELASHGFSHERVTTQSPNAFRRDVRQTKALIEDIAGVPLKGYRAASFSLNHSTLWAFDVLAEEGYAYSSSVYPIRHDHYGMPSAPRFPYEPRPGVPLKELPITTVRLFGRNVPGGGGGYFRLLPLTASVWLLRRFHRQSGQPAIFYFHPWEIDPDQPRMRGVGLRTGFRHYVNLDAMHRKISAMLATFRWDRLDTVFGV